MGLPVVAALTHFEEQIKNENIKGHRMQCVLSVQHGMASALVCCSEMYSTRLSGAT
jgi:hypothetical protein